MANLVVPRVNSPAPQTQHTPCQGLLGGFALLNFFMTYMLYSGGTLIGFLSYYAPLAQNNARIYYSLSVVSVIASTSRWVTA